MTLMIAKSPLSAVYRSRGAVVGDADGFEMAMDFGDLEDASLALSEACVIVDWTHLRKLRVRGPDAVARVAGAFPGSQKVEMLCAMSESKHAILRLAADEFLILCESIRKEDLLQTLGTGRCAISDESGALGALMLAGPRRHEVVERSAAMDLSPRGFPCGRVAQTTVHTIPCTVLRGPAWDLYLQARDYTESLLDAFMDVGRGSGLVLAGLTTAPVDLRMEARDG